MTQVTPECVRATDEGRGYARMLLYSVLFLAVAGWVLLIDSGLISEGQADPVAFNSLLMKRAVGSLIGLLILVFAFAARPSRLRSFSWWAIGIAIVLLALVFTGLGDSARGSRRWLDLGPFSFQPLEFAKLAVIWYLADVLARFGPLDTSKIGRLILFGLPAATVMIMIALQPNLSGAFFILVLGFALACLGGMSRRLMMSLGGIAVLSVAALFAFNPDRISRFVPIFSPLTDLDGAGYQVGMSFWAIVNGEIFGRGPGGSLAMYSLPDHTTDFIFPILCEEYGIAGGLVVIALFALLTYSAFKIALSQNDPFRMLLGCGIALALGFQAAMNIAVTLGIFPTTGVPLPFVSSGGSNLLLTFFEVGLLLNLARTSGVPVESFMPRSAMSENAESKRSERRKYRPRQNTLPRRFSPGNAHPRRTPSRRVTPGRVSPSRARVSYSARRKVISR